MCFTYSFLFSECSLLQLHWYRLPSRCLLGLKARVLCNLVERSSWFLIPLIDVATFHPLRLRPPFFPPSPTAAESPLSPPFSADFHKSKRERKRKGKRIKKAPESEPVCTRSPGRPTRTARYGDIVPNPKRTGGTRRSSGQVSPKKWFS